jgi:hypothetical protein
MGFDYTLKGNTQSKTVHRYEDRQTDIYGWFITKKVFLADARNPFKECVENAKAELIHRE